MPLFAVLTGDIVDSTDLGAEALDRVMDRLRAGAMDISGWAGQSLTGWARRGGDGWQVVHQSPLLAFRSALYLQALVRREGKSLATRIAIATGDGELPLSGDANAGHGPVFTESGRLLETLSGHRLMGHAAGGAGAAALRLADHIAQGWTQAQARALCEALPPGTGPRAEIAERLGITRQAVNQALWSAGFPALEEALAYLEAEA